MKRFFLAASGSLPEAKAAMDTLRGACLGPYLLSLTHGQSGADKPYGQISQSTIQSDTLAQLQSHGLAGVQWRHYNRHDYHAEKLSALQTLRDLMNNR